MKANCLDCKYLVNCEAFSIFTDSNFCSIGMDMRACIVDTHQELIGH